MKHIIYINEAGASVAAKIQAELKDFRITSIRDFDGKFFNDSEALIFIGALGVCVRMIAPYITDKHTDPGVVCVDSAGHNVISVLSGHVGGANALCSEVARILGAILLSPRRATIRVTGLSTLLPVGTGGSVTLTPTK